jgi:hypothetical protein
VPAEKYWCQPRNTHEQTVFQHTAWARRLKVQNGATGDGDWQIELTGSKTSAATIRHTNYGRCNSKANALWEIHPVYAVSAP